MLTEARRNKIAYLYLVSRIRKKGINSLNPTQIREELFQTAEKLGIPVKEAQEFSCDLVLSLIEEAFSAPGRDGGGKSYQEAWE